MPSTDYYLLRMTAEQRDWLLAKLHGAPDDTGTAVVLYSRLLDAELHDGRLQLPAAPAPNDAPTPTSQASYLAANESWLGYEAWARRHFLPHEAPSARAPFMRGIALGYEAGYRHAGREATPDPDPNEAPARIAALLREGYGPVGNAPAGVPTFEFKDGRIELTSPPGEHPHLASREQILERAEKLISHDRAQTYGDARESFTRIGLLWSDIIGTPITATDVARMMIAMKLSRLTRDPAHADSWVDIAGYAALGAEIAEVEL